MKIINESRLQLELLRVREEEMPTRPGDKKDILASKRSRRKLLILLLVRLLPGGALGTAAQTHNVPESRSTVPI